MDSGRLQAAVTETELVSDSRRRFAERPKGKLMARYDRIERELREWLARPEVQAKKKRDRAAVARHNEAFRIVAARRGKTEEGDRG